MIIYYTIGLNNVKYIYELPNAYFQCLYSIYSIRKQWGFEDLIIIYTNNFKPFKLFFDNYPDIYRNIIFRTLPKKYERHTYYFSSYGHSRNYLTLDLLLEFNDTVIYLDPDTGIRKTSDITTRKIIYNLKEPHLYRKETYNNFYFWSGKTLHDVIDFKKEFGLENICAVNNGVMLFPYNDYSINSATKLREMYEYVYDKIMYGIKHKILEPRDIGFADMFSASIVYYLDNWKSLYPDEFWNIINEENKIPYDNPNIPIIHYYNNKYLNGSSKWEKFKQTVINKYGNLII